jgi:1-acyl-sn-glycerol-3-phosphate acyltransferase
VRSRLLPLIHGLVRLTAKLFFRLRDPGREFIPPSGPVILAANHISDWDPPVLGIASRRVPYYMAKSELFRKPLARRLLPRLGAFPVNRKGTDTGAVRTALEILGRGEALAMFPEGTRSRDGLLRKARPGVSMLSRRSGAPVVPAYISGTLRPLRGLTVAFGPPITPEEIEDLVRRNGDGAASLLITERIADAGRRAGVFKGFADSSFEKSRRENA